MVTGPKRRVTDDYPMRDVVEWMKRYAIFWVPLFWLVTQLGFGIITPRVTAAQVQSNLDRGDARLQAEIDSVRIESTKLKAVHEGLQSDVNAIRAETHALVKFDCLSQFISRREKILVGFCDDTLKQ